MTEPKQPKNEFLRSEQSFEDLPVICTRAQKKKKNLVRTYVIKGNGVETGKAELMGYIGPAEWEALCELGEIFQTNLENGESYDKAREFFKSSREILSLTTGSSEKKKRHFSKSDKMRLMEITDNLMAGQAVLYNCFTDKNGTKHDKKRVTYLEEVTLFERKKSDNYFDWSRFRLGTIAELIRDGKITFIRKDVVERLRNNEYATMLYRLLRKNLSHHGTFEKILPALKEELLIDNDREWDLVPMLKKSCKKLVGEPINSEYEIGYCDMERTKQDDNWKIVARRIQTKKLNLIPPIIVKPIVPKVEKKTEENGNKEEPELLEYYQSLSEEERKTIDEAIGSISKERHKMFWEREESLEDAKREAIRRYKKNIEFSNKLLNKIDSSNGEKSYRLQQQKDDDYKPSPHLPAVTKLRDVLLYVADVKARMN